MLKADVNAKKRSVSLVAVGDLAEVINDVAHVINGVYTRLAMGNHPECADEFKKAMILLCADPTSPVFAVNAAATGMTIVTPSEGE